MASISICTHQGVEPVDRIHHFCQDGYSFGATRPLNAAQLQQLVDTFRSPDRAAGLVLGGRRSVSHRQLDGIGAVIIKHYRRGGLLAHLVAKKYLRIAKTRCQIELEQMEMVRQMGVRAPEPIAYAYHGRLFYRAWLVTREIEQCQSMAQLSRTAPDRVTAAMATLGKQIGILVKNDILHADFHPGNVLIDDRDQVYIIDLDKTARNRMDRKKLASTYRRRWCRAVRKHGLPPILCTLLQIDIP